jgi:hypothetical protein
MTEDNVLTTNHPLLRPFAKNEVHELLLSQVNRSLSGLEALLPVNPPENSGLIYIAGMPRSGTTLLSQVLSRGLRVGYINNLIARFWEAPGIGVSFSNAILGPDPGERIEFTSRHGNTFQPEGPHEFGYFWTRRLGLDRLSTHFPDEAHLQSLDIEGLIRTMGVLLTAFGRTVVFKNVICAFFAPFLSRITARTLFIYIHRDLPSVVASILKCRYQRYGSYDSYWSLMPSTFRRIIREQNPVRQVWAQVIDSQNEMLDQLTKPGVTALALSYDQLCEKPAEVCRQISLAFRDLGGRLDIRPTEFPGFSKIPDAMREDGWGTIYKEIEDIIAGMETQCRTLSDIICILGRGINIAS